MVCSIGWIVSALEMLLLCACDCDGVGWTDVGIPLVATVILTSVPDVASCDDNPSIGSWLFAGLSDCRVTVRLMRAGRRPKSAANAMHATMAVQKATPAASVSSAQRLLDRV